MTLVDLQPLLAGVRTASDALGLQPMQLLHAGPPLRDPRAPPPVLMASAVVTIRHEGWAATEADAESLVRSGQVRLEPAQPQGCVTPLALVVSPGTPLFEVEAGGLRMLAPVSAVGGPDTRMGWRDAALPARLAHRDRVLAPAWQRLLAAQGPVPLLPIAAHALRSGDDLHSRTTAATAMLASVAQGRGASVLAEALAGSPLFFLTPWMAASAVLLRAAEGGDVPTLVTRVGGNGESFGLALAARPHEWICVDATPPVGRLASPGTSVAPAIGDSAVIDFLGCGGLALQGAPEPCEAFGRYLPADHAGRAGRLLAMEHPVLGRPVGLDAARAVSERCPPLVALAMLAADGRGGFVGRGLYEPPLDLFESALRA